MIRLVAFLKRKPGMSPEDFQQHWREVHGPLIASSGVARYITRYEQCQPLGSPGDWDGVTIQDFASQEDFEAMLADPDYGAKVHPDEESFLDMGSLVWLLTEQPHVVIQP